MKNLDEARAYQRQAQSRDNSDLWSAILDVHNALSASLPAATVSKAKANLIRAGVLPAGDFTDEELSQMATADGVREWRPDMGTLFASEPVIGPDRETYITQKQHIAQEGWAPGSEGGRTLFRLLRKEPEGEGEYLEDDEEMTQEQFNKFFATAMQQYRQGLRDNDSGEWSKQARAYAVEAGIFAGAGTGADGQPNFMWEDFLTREQAAQILYRFAQAHGLA